MKKLKMRKRKMRNRKRKISNRKRKMRKREDEDNKDEEVYFHILEQVKCSYFKIIFHFLICWFSKPSDNG